MLLNCIEFRCFIFAYLNLWNCLSYPTDTVFPRWSNCRQILLTSEIMVCIGILLSFHIISPYTVPQYVCSGLIMFVSAEVLEGEELFNSTVLLVMMNIKKWGSWGQCSPQEGEKHKQWVRLQLSISFSGTFHTCFEKIYLAILIS